MESATPVPILEPTIASLELDIKRGPGANPVINSGRRVNIECVSMEEADKSESRPTARREVPPASCTTTTYAIHVYKYSTSEPIIEGQWRNGAGEATYYGPFPPRMEVEGDGFVHAGARPVRRHLLRSWGKISMLNSGHRVAVFELLLDKLPIRIAAVASSPRPKIQG